MIQKTGKCMSFRDTLFFLARFRMVVAFQGTVLPRWVHKSHTEAGWKWDLLNVRFQKMPEHWSFNVNES